MSEPSNLIILGEGKEEERASSHPPDPPGHVLQAGLTDLKGMDEEELVRFSGEMGEPPYRGRQLFHWIYARGETRFEAMTDLPVAFRSRLAGRARVGALAPEEVLESDDGTRKFVWRLADGVRIESVRIPMPRAGGKVRGALCVSTQAGCAMGCAFCLTAKMGLVRQLAAGEIAEQFLAARRMLPEGERFQNVVFMGMGEPLDNFEAAARAALLLTHPLAEGISPRRLTVSTVGLVPRIGEFVARVPGVRLAVSLNAADDRTRGRLMPVNRKWNLAALLSACRSLPLSDRRWITFEYVLLGGVNDSPKDAQRLVRLLQRVKCKVNLLPWNPFPGAPFERPAPGRVEAFRQALRRAGFTATVRVSKGLDIGAACGQLADAKRISGRVRRAAGFPAGGTPVPGAGRCFGNL